MLSSSSAPLENGLVSAASAAAASAPKPVRSRTVIINKSVYLNGCSKCTGCSPSAQMDVNKIAAAGSFGLLVISEALPFFDSVHGNGLIDLLRQAVQMHNTNLLPTETLTSNQKK